MKKRSLIYGLFFFAFAAHALFSVYSRPFQARWMNVPPVPSEGGMVAMALGDRQMAYRMMGIMIQNLGDTGGRTAPLYEYDFNRLGEWFMLEDKLDRRSNFIPFLAAYYFGGSQEAGDLDSVIDYLAVAGQHPYTQKWRWLAQAVYLARFRQQDLDKALSLAYILADLNYEKMPGWARQMPAFIASAQGDKETALAIMVGILQNESATMQQAEINFMVDYICTRILNQFEAAQNPLCTELPL